MPQSGVGSMQGSNKDCLPMKGHTRGGDAPTVLPIEWTHRGGMHPQCYPTNGHTYFHRGGGRTHNLPQRTDTHIFTGGGRTHNVTQRTDTQIFFDVSACIYASCARIFARIFMKIWLVVKYYFINISFKFHKDLSFR